MEVLRRIGSHELLIDVAEPCGISLEEDLLRGIPDADGTTLSKRAILRALASGDDYFPLSLHWEVLDKCNFRCPFCYIVGHSFQRVVRFAEIQPHLTALIEEGLLFAILTGGEVTLHPDFCQIYGFLKTHGVIVELFTNGFMISEEMFDLFTRLRPYAVEISLYSLDDAKLRSVYGATGNHPAQTVLNNVLRFKRLGLPVVCKTFLNSQTAQDFRDIARWCEANGVEHYSSSDLTPAYDGADLSAFRVQGREPKKLVILNEGQKNVCLPCGTKNYGCAITPAFELFPCSSIKHRDCYYDIRSLGLREALRQMKAFLRRFQNSEIVEAAATGGRCKTCIAFSAPVRDASGQITHFAKLG